MRRSSIAVSFTPRTLAPAGPRGVLRLDEAPGAGLCLATMPHRPHRVRVDHDDGQDAWAAVPNLIRVRWRPQLRRAAMLLGGVAVPFGWLLALPAAGAQPPAGAQPATAGAHPATAALHTITVADTAEAWYAA